MSLARVLFALVVLSSSATAEPLSEASPPNDRSDPPRSAGPSRVLPLESAPALTPDAPGPGLADRDNDRISDGLAARLSRAPDSQRLDVVVGFDTPAHAAAAKRALGAIALRQEFELLPGFSASMTAGQVRALARMPGIVRLEEVFTVYANMETARRDFGVDRATSELLFDGVGVGLCIVDTGIFAEHEQFVDGGVSKVVGFKDFVGTSLTAYDDHGHGTHVGSIAAGDGTGNLATDPFGARYRGVAPAASLYAAKVLNANGEGTSDGVIAGIDWCAAQPGVDIINLSLGSAGSSDGTDLLSQAVNRAVTERGIVVVVAAGNGGAAPYTVGSPAAASLAITVGAAAEWSTSTLPEGESDGIYLAPFSSRGPTADDRIKPDIVAPGVSIVAAYIDPSGTGLFGCTNDCYASLSGTSMASPFAAGTVALMLQADPLLTTDQVRTILLGTAQDRGPKAADGSASKDNEWGHGLLDAYAAVAATAAAIDNTPTAFPAYSLGTDHVAGRGVTTVPIGVADSSAPLAVTITILDGGPKLFCDIFFGCYQEWRPDFDVRLRDPNGQEVAVGTCMLGSLQGQECDNVGRQETLHVATPVLGTYTLEVYKGTSDSKNGTFRYEVSQGPVDPGEAPIPNQPPVADAGPDQTVTDSDGSGEETVALDGSASQDTDGSIVSHLWSWGGWSHSGVTASVALPVGTNVVTLTVTDDQGATGTDEVVVTVSPDSSNQPPVADAGPDQTVTVPRGTLASVRLDGTASRDPDGAVVSWQWEENGTTLATGANPTVELAEGRHEILLTVTDDDGASATDTVTITVKGCNPKRPGCGEAGPLAARDRGDALGHGHE